MAEIKNILIDLVKQHPLIYDKSHPLHYRTNARNEVWDEIGKILNIPGKLHNCLCRSIYKFHEFMQLNSLRDSNESFVM